MGSASSSLRRIVPVVTAVALLALLFLASSASLPRKASDLVDFRPLPRKLGVQPWTMKEASSCPPTTKGGSTKCSSRRRRNTLPRGLVQPKTNLEMEESVAGNPERRQNHQQQTGPMKKSLLAVPVGISNKDVVNNLVSKFSAANFTIMLFHYDGAMEQWNDLDWSRHAVHVVAHGQTKLWFAKRFLHPDVVASYEYVFLWDEDIEVDAFDPIKYLEVVRKEGLEVSQPALDRRSEIHHAITARPLVPTGDAHRRVQDARCKGDSTGPPCTGWVEVMVPVFSREAWRCTWKMLQNDLIHGWGLDYKLGYCAQGDRTRKVGVVDSQYVLHRGTPMLKGDDNKAKTSNSRGAVRWQSFKEMKMFNKRWEEAAAEDKSWTDPFAAQPAAAAQDD